jgi:polysaccharide biosynthesis transport protein
LNANSTTSTVDVNLGDVLRGMLTRVPLIATCLILGALLGYLIVTVLKPNYFAEATIIIEQPINALPQTSVAGQAAQQQTKPDPVTDRDIVAQIGIMASNEIARMVTKQLKLDQKKEFAEYNPPGALKRFLIDWGFTGDEGRQNPELRVSTRLYRGLSIYQVTGSNLIKVKYTGSEPQLAADIANSWAKAFIMASEDKQVGSAGRNREWLAQQIEDLRPKVAESEREAEAFRARSGLIKGERDTLNTQQISELNSQVTVASGALSEAQAKAKEIKSILAKKGSVDTSNEVISAPGVQVISDRLTTARSRLTELSATYLEKHPRIIAARQDIRALEAQLKREALKIVGSLEGQAEVAKARVEDLEAQLAQLKTTAAAENLDEVRLRELERNASANRTLLESLLSRYAEANAVRSVAPMVGVARLIEEAVAPYQVNFPKKGPILLLSTLAGLGLGLGLAFLLSLLGATTRPRQAFAGSNLVGQTRPNPDSQVASMPPLSPALDISPHVANGAEQLRVPSLFEVQAPQQPPAPLPAVSATQPPPPVHSVSAAAPEETRQEDVVSYMTSLIEQEIANNAKPRVSFTRIGGDIFDSAGGALAAARAMAARGRKVLLIDCDSQFRAVQVLLGLADGAGLSDIVAGQGSFGRVITRDPDSKVHVVRYGTTTGEASLATIGQRMPAILRSLETIYDVFVIHGGPARPGIVSTLQSFPVAFIMGPEERRNEAHLAADSLAESGVVDVHFIQLAAPAPVQQAA